MKTYNSVEEIEKECIENKTGGEGVLTDGKYVSCGWDVLGDGKFHTSVYAGYRTVGSDPMCGAFYEGYDFVEERTHDVMSAAEEYRRRCQVNL